MNKLYLRLFIGEVNNKEQLQLYIQKYKIKEKKYSDKPTLNTVKRWYEKYIEST